MNRSRSASSAVHRLAPPKITSPRRGGTRPIITRRTELFPQPLPPMTMKTLPRSTSKFRLRWTTKVPYPMSRSRTAMAAGADGGLRS